MRAQTRRRARPRRGHLAARVVGWLLAVVVVWLVVNLGLVWRASRQDQARPAQAIVVLGSAEYNGVPSPDLAARLSHALVLWQRRLAPVIVVTGGRQQGDRFTEAAAAAGWLAAHGVPASAVLREVSGRNTWESLDASAAFLRARHIRAVLLVSDPYHNDRISLMATELGLTPYVSPTRTSPIRGGAVVPYFAKETVEVSIGRVTGFRVLARLESLFGGPFGLH